MDVSIKQIHELIRKGEGISVEFKTCRNKINRDVYETVCAFLNRHGGTILLGVQDDGTLQGIEPDAVTQLKKDLVTSVNNPLKLTPPTYLSVDVVELDGKCLLCVSMCRKAPRCIAVMGVFTTAMKMAIWILPITENKEKCRQRGELSCSIKANKRVWT